MNITTKLTTVLSYGAKTFQCYESTLVFKFLSTVAYVIKIPNDLKLFK